MSGQAPGRLQPRRRDAEDQGEMSRYLSLVTLLAALAVFTFGTVAPAHSAAAAPSAKRCKAVKAKKRKSKADRATLVKCRKQAAEAAAKKKSASKPAAGPSRPSSTTGPAATGALTGASDAAAPTATPTPTPTPIVPDIPTGSGRAVQVRGFEFGLTLSRAEVLAGTVRVEYNLTSAEDPHSLIIYRVDGDGSSYSFPEQPSQSVTSKSLNLTAGRWRLLCDLPGHAAAGMQVDLTVR